MASQTSGPTVMFGVGAAKAGTSWLHRCLSDHPECYFRAIKELHYFNALDGVALERNRDRVLAIRDRLLEEAEGDISPVQLANKVKNIAQVEHFLEVLDLGREDLDAYHTYLADGCGDAKVVGELTPAYALLSKSRLETMSKIAADVRFVFLLRDPVERLWSHVRMIAKQRSADASDFASRSTAILARVFGGKEEQIAWRSDYAGPLARLSSVVAPEKLFVGIFEDMFKGDALTRLCDFLGISDMSPKTNKFVNAGLPLSMTPHQRAMAQDWLAPQYQAVRDHFGALPTSWTQDLTRVS